MTGSRHFFITGGIGIVGLELIPRLLRRHGDARITLLIRPRGDTTADKRLETAKAWIRGGWPEVDLRRLDAVPGDVSLPGLGLDTAARAHLRSSVTDIVNGAAKTRLDGPGARSWWTNVFGTMECLEFARSCLKLGHYAHISTAYVCGDREGIIRETELRSGQQFLNAYESTKYQAEILVQEEGRRLPVTIFRPSIVVGDSRSGRIASFGAFYRTLRSIAVGELRCLPCPESARVDLVPVDYVVECMVRLMERGGDGETYHLCAGPGRRTGIRRLFETAIAVSGNRGGAPLQFLPVDRCGTESVPDTVWKYPRLEREFCDARARAHLGGRPERPCPDDFLLPVVRYGCRGLRSRATDEEASTWHPLSVPVL